MGRIVLQAFGFNDWLDSIEQELTCAADVLERMAAESGQLREVWRSGAGELWKAEFVDILAQVGEVVTKIRKVILKMEEAARQLADLEKAIKENAEEL